jgi:putative ABC transport system permease protein
VLKYDVAIDFKLPGANNSGDDSLKVLKDSLKDDGEKDGESGEKASDSATKRTPAEELVAFEAEIAAANAFSSYTEVYQEAVTVNNSELSKDAYLVVSFDPAHLGDYIEMNKRPESFAPEQVYQLDDSGVILTEQLARQFNVGIGDVIHLRTLDNEEADFKVTGIVENYVLHYIYMTPAAFSAGFGKSVEPNQLMAFMAPGQSEVPQSLTDYEYVTAVSYMSESADRLRDQLDILSFVVAILIISAAALIFVVLFSLTTINIEERRRELASIEVLGFTDRELAAYIYRENIIVTLAGTLAGVGLGVLLQRYIIITMEIDVFMFARDLLWTSYALSIILTLFFAIVVNLGMYRSITRINMVEALKAVE